MSIIYEVPQGHCIVLERFGKFARIHRAGLRFRIPFLEQIRRVDNWNMVANKLNYQIELSEQLLDTPPRQCHTKDNVPVEANASIYWRITDPVRAVYEVDILPDAIKDVALNALRSNIGVLQLDALLSERAQLNEKIAAQLTETGKKWGVVITRVEIQEIKTDKNVSDSMVKQMDAERRRRAIVAEAEGKAEATLKVAEAEKQAAIMKSEGEAIAKVNIAEAEAFYLKRLKEQVGEDAAMQIIIAQKYLSGFEVISKNAGDKVFLPNSFQAVMSLSTDTKADRK